MDHGTQCFRSEAECEQGRVEIMRETTPCSRDAGAGLLRDQVGKHQVFPESVGLHPRERRFDPDGTCKRTDR